MEGIEMTKTYRVSVDLDVVSDPYGDVSTEKRIEDFFNILLKDITYIPMSDVVKCKVSDVEYLGPSNG